jgi:ketosteroid isomerase-like protein
MDATDNHAIVERYWRAMTDGDLRTVGELFTDDVLVEWPQSGERFQGKEKCLNLFANYPGGSPKLVELRRISGHGDVVVGEMVLDYPDGKRYDTVGIFEFRDGKIAHETDYFAEPFPVPEWRMQWLDRR